MLPTELGLVIAILVLLFIGDRARNWIRRQPQRGAATTPFRASMLLSVAHGERQLVERELRSDHRIMQRVNLGVPVNEDAWSEIGRFADLDDEIERMRVEGWKVERGG